MLNMDFDTFTVFYDIVVNAFLALLPFVYCFWLMDMAMDVILVISVTYIGKILCIGFCLQQLVSRLFGEASTTKSSMTIGGKTSPLYSGKDCGYGYSHFVLYFCLLLCMCLQWFIDNDVWSVAMGTIDLLYLYLDQQWFAVESWIGYQLLRLHSSSPILLVVYVTQLLLGAITIYSAARKLKLRIYGWWFRSQHSGHRESDKVNVISLYYDRPRGGNPTAINNSAAADEAKDMRSAWVTVAICFRFCVLLAIANFVIGLMVTVICALLKCLAVFVAVYHEVHWWYLQDSRGKHRHIHRKDCAQRLYNCLKGAVYIARKERLELEALYPNVNPISGTALKLMLREAVCIRASEASLHASVLSGFMSGRIAPITQILQIFKNEARPKTESSDNVALQALTFPVTRSEVKPTNKAPPTITRTYSESQQTGSTRSGRKAAFAPAKQIKRPRWNKYF